MVKNLFSSGIHFRGDACDDQELIDWAVDRLSGYVATGCKVIVSTANRSECEVKLNDLVNKQVHFGSPQRIAKFDFCSPETKGDVPKIFVTAERRK
jgi:hypothetical protein